jgi:hypothetical protein
LRNFLKEAMTINPLSAESKEKPTGLYKTRVYSNPVQGGFQFEREGAKKRGNKSRKHIAHLRKKVHHYILTMEKGGIVPIYSG